MPKKKFNAALFVGDRDGFTLVEVMIALAVFAVGIMAVAKLQATSISANTVAQDTGAQVVNAADRVERIFSLPYTDPLLVDADGVFNPANPDQGPFNIAVAVAADQGASNISNNATIEWEVQDNFPVPNAKRIQVMIRWNDGKVGQWNSTSGNQRNVTYSWVKSRDFR